MSPKEVGPPSGTDELTEMLRQRRVRTDDPASTPKGNPAPVAPVVPVAPPVPPAPARKPRSQGTGMDRRSWYMPKVSADALADAVEDLHYDTRQPKHEVLRVLVEIALEHRAEIRSRLRKR